MARVELNDEEDVARVPYRCPYVVIIKSMQEDVRVIKTDILDIKIIQKDIQMMQKTLEVITKLLIGEDMCGGLAGKVADLWTAHKILIFLSGTMVVGLASVALKVFFNL